MSIFGEYFPDGRVKSEPDTCAKTGRRVNKDTGVRIRIPNSPYFVRVHHNAAHDITEADTTAWANGAPPLPSAVPAPVQFSKPAVKAESEVKP